MAACLLHRGTPMSLHHPSKRSDGRPDVVCLSHLRWNFVYQRPNHLMSRYAREHRVFYVEEPIFDEAPESAGRLEFFETREPWLEIVVPHLRPGMPLQEVDASLRQLLDQLVEAARIRDPLLWLYTPMLFEPTKHLRRSGLVYDCMDELSLFRHAPPELVTRERDLISSADVVFTGGHGLWEAKRHLHPRIHPFPSSVDVDHFGQARIAMNEPEDQRVIARPRLGFFGVLDERLDIELLQGAAERKPDWQFVMVGPVVKIDPATLPRRPNIHYLGPRNYEQLPSYLAGWDVTIMPFARNESTRFISPTKTLEYLAAGKPVVSTSIRDVVRHFAAEQLVRIADSAADFVSEVEGALSERDTPRGTKRRADADAMLARTSWDRTWSRMRSLVQSALSRRHADTTEEAAPCSTI
ncbi:Glycosyltransferase [Labilithrix luteola]|uniref:Glycosyltransferase n=2 Tax=Labilithrix luteola TaxID=1391654 RepID=A0A0K1PVQ4_9BACT|nr:Glycosyltransferase [Labilithrix luteola]